MPPGSRVRCKKNGHLATVLKNPAWDGTTMKVRLDLPIPRIFPPWNKRVIYVEPGAWMLVSEPA